MKRLRVGIIGCGTAGPAAALFLADAGHEVTLYERATELGPVGAGIMLQPTGQAVLARLGLLDHVIARAARIDRLHVVRANGRPLVDLSYAVSSDRDFGLGLHRGVLFETLLSAVRRTSVALRLGIPISGYVERKGVVELLTDSGRVIGTHDVLVIADGARSRLRLATGLVRSAIEYPWGALWFVAEDPNQTYRDELFQIVDGANTLLGLLPTGLGPASQASHQIPKTSIFWSLPTREIEAFRAAPIDVWKERVMSLDPNTEALLSQVERPEDLLFSSYVDVVMSPWNTGRVVCLGDAAHAMSPQLGQGANLALFDAMTLADCVTMHEGDVVRALHRYSQLRRDHLNYYQVVTRWLTPFFQSDHDALGLLRDLSMPLLNRFRLFNRAMVIGMCGTADGHPWRTVDLPRPLAVGRVGPY